MQNSIRLMTVFFQEMAIFLAGALPILLVLAIIGLPIFYFMRNRKPSMDASLPNDDNNSSDK